MRFYPTAYDLRPHDYGKAASRKAVCDAGLSAFKPRGLLLLAFAALCLSACTPTLAVRGNILEDFQVASVVVGQDTQADVLHKLGSPTTKAAFDDSTWLYMGQRTEKRGILDPKIREERIYEVRFDDKGVVSQISDVTQPRLAIPYERDKTPTTGSELTVAKQLLGNLGRFNKDESKKKSSGDQDGNK